MLGLTVPVCRMNEMFCLKRAQLIFQVWLQIMCFIYSDRLLV